MAALLLALLVPCAAGAQTITMEAQGLTFDYPESWIVISPQLAMVYAPLLEENGIDASALSQDMEAQGVLSRAYRQDFAQHMSVIARADDLSGEIFDIAEITDAQRRELRRMAENNTIWGIPRMHFRDTQGAGMSFNSKDTVLMNVPCHSSELM